MSNNLDDIKLLGSKYWQGIVSAISGIIAGIKVVYDFNAGASSFTKAAIPIAVAVFVMIIIRFPKVSYFITLLFTGPPGPLPDRKIFRGGKPFFTGEKLPGRDNEVDDCWRIIRLQPFFILQGESGSGKSSFINAGLKPKMLEKYRVVECRFVDDPFGRLLSAFSQTLYNLSADRPDANTTLNAISAATTLFSEDPVAKLDLNKPLILIVDQSEELFVNVKDETRIAVIDLLRKAIMRGYIRLVMVIRNDFLGLMLSLCRSSDSDQKAFNLGSFFELEAFSDLRTIAILDEMFAPFYNDPLKKTQLKNFSSKLVTELLRPPRDSRVFAGDKKTVLAVELQITGMMIESIGMQKVIDKGIDYYWGKIGLMGLYIDQAKAYVMRKAKVDGDSALLVLRQLISPAGTKWALKPQVIADNMNIPEGQVRLILDSFCEQFLVKTIGDENDQLAPGEVQYEFLHEYLVKVLKEAPQPILQAARDAEERLNFWEEQTERLFSAADGTNHLSFKEKLSTAFMQPIPLSETIKLWKFATERDDKNMLKRNLKGYLRRVGVCLAPVILVCAGLFIWAQTDTYQVDSMTRTSPTDELAASNDGTSIISSWAIALVDINKPNDAFAPLEKIKNNRDRSNSLALLANELVATGYTLLADSALNLSFSVRGSYWGDNQKKALLAVAPAMSKANKVQAMVRQIQNIQDEKFRLNAQAWFAEALLKSNRLNDRRTILDDIFKSLKTEDDNDILFTLADNAALDQKDMDRPMHLLLRKSSVDLTYKIDPFLMLTLAFIKENDFNDATATWNKAITLKGYNWNDEKQKIVQVIQAAELDGKTSDFCLNLMSTKDTVDKNIRDAVLAGLLVAGNYQEYAQMAGKLPPDADQQVYYAGAIDTLLKHKKDKEAEYLLSKVDFNKITKFKSVTESFGFATGQQQEYAYQYSILKALIKFKNFDQALKLATDLNYDISLTGYADPYSPLGYTVIEIASSGNDQKAYENMDHIINKYELNQILSLLVIEKLKTGKMKEADNLLKKLIANYITLKNYSTQRSYIFHGFFPLRKWEDKEIPISEIAVEEAKAGRLKNALALSKTYISEDLRYPTLRQMAIELAKGNKTEPAARIIRLIDTDQLRSQVYSETAILLADTDKTQDAAAFLTGVMYDDDRSVAVAALARSHARSGNFRLAVQTAATCSSPDDQLKAYIYIMEKLAIKKRPQYKSLFLKNIQSIDQ